MNVAALRRHALEITTVVELVEARCMGADGPVTPTLQEITEGELRRLWLAAKAIVEGSERTEDAATRAALKRTLAKARAAL